MTEEEKKELDKEYSRVFDYDPSFEEVQARYDDDFNNWCDNFFKNKK